LQLGERLASEFFALLVLFRFFLLLWGLEVT
jgi:hypothetical protein